jgi:cytochrome P450
VDTTELTAAPEIAPDGGASLLTWLEKMRADTPVWRDDAGAWHVFRSADVRRVSTDAQLFSSDTTRLTSPGDQAPPGTLLVIDPPEHRKLRRLVSQAFTPKVVADLEPRITELTRELLAEVKPDATEFDLVDVLAYPLPVIVIAELLGVPATDRALFRGWAEALMALQVDDPSTGEKLAIAIEEMEAYLNAQIADRRAQPRDDLLTRLVESSIDGERLTDEEVGNFTALLLLAGHVTTTMLLGNVLLCLEDAPGVYERVRAEPSLVEPLLEEVLRLRPPFPRVVRVTTADVEVAGTVIPADSIVWAWVVSANYDEREFAGPARFDLTRKAGAHAAFGHGIHFCLGAPLARLEGRIALELLFERFEHLRIAPGADVPFHAGGVFGVQQLPVTTTAG